ETVSSGGAVGLRCWLRRIERFSKKVMRASSAPSCNWAEGQHVLGHLGPPMASGQFGPVIRQLRSFLGAQAARASTDGELLQKFVTDKDQSAYAGLVERYAPLVLGVCRRILQVEHAAEDAFQATFLVLWRKAD